MASMYLSPGAFSTRTSVLDLRSGRLVASLESLAVIKDGRPNTSPDMNFWGVTIAHDDRTFYATMATAGQTYLARGDLVARAVMAIRENVECPSLSPDGMRIAFKKRVDADGGRSPWRLFVLDLATLHEHALAEQHSVDDQAVWLDDSRVAYALPGPGTSTYDVWSVPADGSGTPGSSSAVPRHQPH
jgi:Tol biopolymer transport system component